MRQLIAMLLVLMVCLPLMADVFISEYIEGSSNNKAVEIFNAGPDAVDLSNYTIKMATNGASWGSYTFNLSGTLDVYEVYVLANSSSVAEVRDLANQTSGSLTFNGDDGVGLFLGSTIIDQVGKENNRMVWPVAGSAGSTQNHTLVRKPNVFTGNTDWTASAGTDTDNSEWIVYPVDTFDHLGSHTMDAGSDPVLDITAPNGGETWYVGETYDITWDYLNLDGPFYLMLARETNPEFEYQITNAATEGSYSWTIPAGFDTGNDFRLAIWSEDDDSPFEIADANFSIEIPGPVVNITAPTAGDVWYLGNTYNITWTSEFYNTEVMVGVFSMSNPDVPVMMDVAEVTAGTYSWTIDTSIPAGNDYVVLVGNPTREETYDISDEFTIAEAPVIADLVLNEFLADPGTTDGDANEDGTIDSSQDEFIEIVNNDEVAVNLGGYTLCDAIDTRHTFPHNTLLAPGHAIVVFGGGTLNGSWKGSQVQTASTGMLGLNNSGDTITLYDADDNEVFSYTYGGEAGDNQSITRNPDVTGGYVQHTSLPGSYPYSPAVRVDLSYFVPTTTSNVETATVGVDGYHEFPGPTASSGLNILHSQGNMGNVVVTAFVGEHAPFAPMSILQWWNIEVGADQPATIDFYYDEANLNGVDENLLQVWHYTGGAWVLVGGIVDTAANTITITNYNGGFSPFTLAGDTPLPVELSSFTATVTSENYVQLNWAAQSETDMLGYYVFRGQSDDVAQAISLNELIPAGNASTESQYTTTDIDVEQGQTYWYWLQSNDLDGSSCMFGPISITVVEGGEGGSETPEVPMVTGLMPNYPNPFNPSTTVRLSLTEESVVSVDVYNARGQHVSTLLRDTKLGKGTHDLVWDASGNGSGVYFVRMTTSQDTYVRKMLLMQ